MGASSRRRCFSWAPRWEGLSPKNVVQGLAAWVAVLTTMAGALGAHIEAARFDQLAIGYRATARASRRFAANGTTGCLERPFSQAQKDHFVSRCEGAISVENQAWMAEWSGSDEGMITPSVRY
ncbi:MAG: SLATT domain-containing protein [Gammaproteobacteria bacterium]